MTPTGATKPPDNDVKMTKEFMFALLDMEGGTPLFLHENKVYVLQGVLRREEGGYKIFAYLHSDATKFRRWMNVNTK